jgi:transcriptional regulator with XRE-family HTH domain
VSDFSKWLKNEFFEWQKTEGEIKNLTDFAKYLNVSQPNLSKWVSGGSKPRDSENIEKLASKLGSEVYELLGFTPPIDDPLLKSIASIWKTLTQPEKEELETRAKTLKEQREKYGEKPKKHR